MSAPLLSLAKSEKFTWGKLEAESFEYVKTLIQLDIKNYHVNVPRPLFVATDTTQISVGFILFQITPDGYMKLIRCDSKLLRQSMRNKGASKRELISLGFALVENEHRLQNHLAPILLMSDASSLQLLSRAKLCNNSFAELGIFLSSFHNLGVFYTLGSSLFLADLLSRSYNQIVLKGWSNISKEFSKLLPFLPQETKQKIITPEQLTDFLVTTTPKDKLDCFSLYRTYAQINSRYRNLTNFKKIERAVYHETNLLAALFCGFDESALTQEKLPELNERLVNFPASSLSTKLKNPHLGKLHKKLTEVGMHREFMAILAR